jgi:hypothetical protein
MLAVVTSNPRFYQNAVKELEKKGLNFLSLRIEDKIPPEVETIITSLSERDSVSFDNVVAANSAAVAVREALYEKKGLKKRYKSISIGVDPGKSIGVAALGDRRIIFEEIIHNPGDVVATIKKIEERFRAENIMVKVGSAGGAYRNRIISSIQENFDFPLEIVDESSTTGPKVESHRQGLHKDIFAARKIASKSGKPLSQTIKVTSTPGEIKNIQRESRKKSEQITISKRLAEAVVRGEIDLDEAIRLQKKGRIEDVHSF